MVLSNLDWLDSELPLVDPKNFRSLKVTVILKNFTLPQDTKFHFELLEMENNSVTLDVPDLFCTQGHSLLLGISIPDQPHFIATSKVTSVESIDICRARVQVSLVQYDKKSWSDIQTAFAARQAMVTRLLCDAKGY
jgi:hypothetical protein